MVRSACIPQTSSYILVCPKRLSSKEKSTPGTSAIWQKSRIRVGLPPPHSDTCIKGHRSSACKHTDRPLFEIQKKGRPVTQCSHCRELRKTKQVHVKCNCGDLRPGKGDSGAGKSLHSSRSPLLQPARPQLPRKRRIPRFRTESLWPSPLSSL